VQVEHVHDDVAAAPSARNSSLVRQSSPVVQPSQESLAEGRTRRQIVRLVILIEECNVVAFPLSVAEEDENSKNY
jgi:hypothetical protein